MSIYLIDPLDILIGIYASLDTYRDGYLTLDEFFNILDQDSKTVDLLLERRNK